MSVVSLLGVNVLNNPAKFGDPYEFEITFECLELLQKGIPHCRCDESAY
jgi:histone chaperone ASF1